MPLVMEVGLGPGDIVLDGDPAPHPAKRHSSPTTFRPMPVVAKRSPTSATAELLSDIIHCNVQNISKESSMFTYVLRDFMKQGAPPCFDCVQGNDLQQIRLQL